MPEEGRADLDQEGGGWNILYLAIGLYIISHKQDNPENLRGHFIYNIWLSNSPNCNPFDYYVWDMVEWETNKLLCSTKIELKSRIMAEFKQGYLWKRLQKILKLSTGHGWSQWWFLQINSIYCISRYFHVILVNISDKGIYIIVIFF